jgi:hypothetical protein
MMMTVVERRLRNACAVALVAGTFGVAAPAVLADQAWTPPAPDTYPTGWNVKSTPAPQVYEHKIGTGTMALKPTQSSNEAWTAPAPDSYPPGWEVRSTPAAQAYDYKVGTGTMELKATGQAPPPVTQNARVIYQMEPGPSLRYHRIAQ